MGDENDDTGQYSDKYWYDEIVGDIPCEVCGVVATRYIGKAVLPICDNVVCFHTRIEEVNKMLQEFNEGETIAYL